MVVGTGLDGINGNEGGKHLDSRRYLIFFVALLLSGWILEGLPDDVSAQLKSVANTSQHEEKETMNEEFVFEVLKSFQGSLYDQELQRWKGTISPPKEWLKPHKDSDDWRTAVTAMILIGWIEHGPMYNELLANLDAEDIESAGRSAAGLNLIWDKYRHLAETKFKKDILPLCWEVILKHSTSWPNWKVVTFFRMMEAVPHEDSLEPLIWFIENTDNDALSYSAVKSLARLKKEIVAPRLKQSESINVRIRTRLEDALEELEDASTP